MCNRECDIVECDFGYGDCMDDFPQKKQCPAGEGMAPGFICSPCEANTWSGTVNNAPCAP